jgi:hypothetical protein
VLDAFPTQITFSLDGMSEAVNTAVRVGSDHAMVLANAHRFAAYASERGTRFDLSFCVLRQNWQELADLVRFADELGGEAHAQIVLERSQGLHRLPIAELTPIVDELARQGEALEVSEANQRTWDRMVDWLRGEIRQRRLGAFRIWEGPGPENLAHTRDRRAAAGPEAGDVDTWRATLARWSTNGAVGELHTDAHDRVVAADVTAILPPDRPGAPELVGAGSLDALGALVEHLGPHLWIIDEFVTDGVVEQTLFLAPTALRDKSGLVVRMVSSGDGNGGIRSLLAADTFFWPVTRPEPVAVALR